MAYFEHAVAMQLLSQLIDVDSLKYLDENPKDMFWT
jgi:hypothetical protein